VTASSPVEREVAVPGLQAWRDGLVGLTGSATAMAIAAVERAAELGCRNHHGAFDAAIVAAWACLRCGRLSPAERFAAEATATGTVLGHDWYLVRAAEIGAWTDLAARRPDQALRTLFEVRRQLAAPDSDLAEHLAVPEAVARWQLGRPDDAVAVLAGSLERPEARLVRAAMAVDAGDRGVVEEMLEGCDAWPFPQRVEAGVVLGVARSDERRLVAAVEDAAATDLVGPFLGQGRRVRTALLRLSLETTHPTLVKHLRKGAVPSTRPVRIVDLTARECSILDLLSSHLSYAGIADELGLSVNTVKGNLKSIYRKLDVSARAEAVDVAISSGMV